MLASNIWPPNVDTIKRSAALSCNGLRFITSGYVNDGFKLGSKHPIQYVHLSTQEGGYKFDLSTEMGARKYVGYLQHLGQKASSQMEIVHSVHKTKILFCYTVKRGFRFFRPQPLIFFSVYPLVQ